MNAKQLLFIPPLAVGIGLFWWMNNVGQNQKAPDLPEQAMAVRVLDVKKEAYVPSTYGFGRLESVQSWSAIAQVEGRAIYLDPELAVGKLVTKDSTLIEIDPRGYEIALDRAKANKNSAQAALDELQTSEANDRATLKLEQEVEAILQSDLDRQIELKGRGSASQSTVDTARRSLIAQQKVVLAIENTLRLIPAQKASLEATMATRDVEIEEAQRSLDNTVIKAPFTGMVSEKSIAQNQQVREANSMLTIEDTSASEVVAEFQPYQLGQLFRSVANLELRELIALSEAEDVFDRISKLNLKATVSLPESGSEVEWPAELVRFKGTADSSTGAQGVVVRIKEPYKPDPVNRRPPIANGTFVKVVLSAEKPVEAIRVPRSTIHKDDAGEAFVYVMDEDSRLATKKVMLGAALDENVVVVDGLSEGDKLVVSEPIPAIIGMLLEPVAMTDAS